MVELGKQPTPSSRPKYRKGNAHHPYRGALLTSIWYNTEVDGIDRLASLKHDCFVDIFDAFLLKMNSSKKVGGKHIYLQ